MSKRSRRTTLRVFREMVSMTSGHRVSLEPKPRQRWRAIVRLLARQSGLRFSDAFLFTRFRGCERIQKLAMADWSRAK